MSALIYHFEQLYTLMATMKSVPVAKCNDAGAMQFLYKCSKHAENASDLEKLISECLASKSTFPNHLLFEA